MRSATGLLFGLLFLTTTTLFAATDNDGYVGPNNIRGDKTVTKYKQDKRGIPNFIEGKLSQPTAVGMEVQAAVDYFTKNKAAFRMKKPAEELRSRQVDFDPVGMRHVRFDQFYQGVRVYGSEMITHFDKSGVLKTINGNYEPDISISISPTILPNDAVQTAVTDLRSFWGDGTPSEPELIVYPWEGTTYLTYRFYIVTNKPMGRWEYFVDAHTGAVIRSANRIMNDNDIGSGTSTMGDPRTHIDTDWNGSDFRMWDDTRQSGNNVHGHNGQMPAGNYIQTNVAGATLPGSIALDPDNVWNDPTNQSPAVDGHVYSSLVYDWMLTALGRNGWDDGGASMLTIVNYSGDGDNNAYWDGTRIVVWSWSAGWRSLAACPDVIAHEWGHAVTERTSNLIYEKESGALNESFSDMMGAAFEFAHPTYDTPDWQMGENGRTSGVGFRSMSDPPSMGDPGFYGTSDPNWFDVVGCTPAQTNDWCGVHTNSGVGNKWFYLLSDGGTQAGVTVIGIGVDNAIKIAYRANAFYWTSNTDYHQAALGTVSAADDLDPTGAWSLQVANAWNAVGVSTPAPGVAFSYPSGIPSLLTPGAVTSFDVVVTGTLGGSPVPGSGQIHYSIDGAAWVSTPMTETTPNNYIAELPAGICNQRYRFFVSADEATNGTFYGPADTTQPNQAVVANSSILLFDDNGETNMGWTVSGNATDGIWDRGIPVNDNRGDPPSDYDGSGQCWLTDNIAGNSDVDGGTTSLTSPTIDLSSGDAQIQYALWYSNNVGADPNTDIFEIYISNDNGGSWTLAETVGPAVQSNGGWFIHSFWASDFVTPTATMKLRFDASDLGNPSVVEAALDAITFTQYSCTSTGPVITTTILPDWTENIAYSQQLTATGGTGTLIWSDMNSDLVGTGLTLSSTGLLSGMPTPSGVISFTAQVTDQAAQSDQKLLSFTINPTLTIATTSLPNGSVGTAYSQQLLSNGGTGTIVWSDKNSDLAGTGLSLSSSGLLSGTPNSATTILFTARAVDSVLAAAEQALSLTINSNLTITTVSIPDSDPLTAYNTQLTASSGVGVLVWTDLNSDLVGSGLTLSASGLLTGTALSVGPISFTASVTDDALQSDQKLFTFNINSALTISTTTLPDWTAGHPYSQQLQATSSVGIVNWSDLNSNLVGTGLSLDSSGLLSGTALSAGPISFTAKATDQALQSAQQLLTFTVNPSLVIATDSLLAGSLGVAYSQQLVSSGGTGTVSWLDKNGDLAGSGLTLSSSGLLSGTLLVGGSVIFTAQATDSVLYSTEKLLSLTILSSILVTTDSLPDGDPVSSYSFQLTSSNGVGPLTWTDRDNSLVGTGLTLSSGGLLSGLPLAVGTISFTARVSDSIGQVGEKLLSMTANSTISITTTSLPDWTTGYPYSQQLQAVSSVGTAVWSDKNNNLAGTGLSVSPAGLVSGTPTALGTLAFTARIIDDALQVDEQFFTITVNQTMQIQTTSLPGWTAGLSYVQTLVVTGGSGTKIWSDKNNDLTGTGLSLSSNGIVSGTPSTGGIISFIADVRDQAGDSAEQALTVNVSPVVAHVTDTVDEAIMTVFYSFQLQSSGGTGTHAWNVLGGGLSGSGISLASNGLLSGMPIDTGLYSFLVEVTDSLGASAQKQFNLKVGPEWICGDVDNNRVGPDIGDLTALISYLFINGPPPDVPQAANVDGTGIIDISDITVLIGFLFLSNPPMTCAP